MLWQFLFTGQLGRFLVRSVVITEQYAEFWAAKATMWFELPQFALALGEAAVTEAAVERSFSIQGKIFSKLRASLTQSHCEAQLWLAMNYISVMCPKVADDRAKHSAIMSEKQRANHQSLIDELVSKRQKR